MIPPTLLAVLALLPLTTGACEPAPSAAPQADAEVTIDRHWTGESWLTVVRRPARPGSRYWLETSSDQRRWVSRPIAAGSDGQLRIHFIESPGSRETYFRFRVAAEPEA